ncbi:hypothetical protein U9M48_019558 [Paspalum notatum var. saurae]|uniref:SWIM-type domain-containing protein n=1 Tax=Paspalum notatum var. saurae TaxID=547442 RepID=A0AAQ3TFL6_PASNO
MKSSISASFFCCFKACIDGFRDGCRPYLSIDSTALNGMWNGHTLTACAIDGHNRLFLVAFELFESETKENWAWFLEQLRSKGLIEAVKQVFPWAEHRECFRHLMENMKKNFTGTEYAKYMWPAARAYTPKKHRSKFSELIKCDYINNNLAESWNSWIKELKNLPPDAMADAIRERMVVLFEKRRKISSALSGTILPAVFHQLNAASKGLTHLRVTKGNSEQAEVTEIYKDEAVRRHVVYLKDHHCTCRQWKISGKPCPHALALITTER